MEFPNHFNSFDLIFGFLLLVIVQLLSCVWLFVTPELQHTRLSCPPLSPGVCSSSCPLSLWCHPTISVFSDKFHATSNLFQILIVICHVGFTPCWWAETCSLEDRNLFYCPLQCCLCRSSVQRCTFIEGLSVIPHPLLFPPLGVQGRLWVNNPIRLSLQNFNFCQKTLWHWRVGI